MALPREDSKPWYRQFWPWFIMFFPATAVVAGLITVVIAVKTDDGMVSDNYYKEGLGINKRLEHLKEASKRGITIKLHKDEQNNLRLIFLETAENPAPAYIKVVLTHPTLPEYDAELTLLPTPDKSEYIAQIPAKQLEIIKLSNWHIRVSDPENQWEIEQRLKL